MSYVCPNRWRTEKTPTSPSPANTAATEARVIVRGRDSLPVVVVIDLDEEHSEVDGDGNEEDAAAASSR